MIEPNANAQSKGAPVEPTPVQPASMCRLARVMAEVCRLPAVATMDWCDRAASALSRLSHGSIVLAIIARADGSGRVLAHEAVGVAAAADHRACATDRVQDAAPGLESCLVSLRSRAEQLTSLAFESNPRGAEVNDGFAAPRVGAFEMRSGELVRLWAGVPSGGLAAAWAPLSDSRAGRVVAVQAATPEPDPDLPGMLAAAMPVLAERARRAMDAVEADSRGWLTAREQRVLEHLTLGWSVRQIADMLRRSPHTIHDHVKSLHRKLHASTRGQLIARALGHAPPDEAGDAPTVVVAPGVDRIAAGAKE